MFYIGVNDPFMSLKIDFCIPSSRSKIPSQDISLLLLVKALSACWTSPPIGHNACYVVPRCHEAPYCLLTPHSSSIFLFRIIGRSPTFFRSSKEHLGCECWLKNPSASSISKRALDNWRSSSVTFCRSAVRRSSQENSFVMVLTSPRAGSALGALRIERGFPAPVAGEVPLFHTPML